ncbi:MAG: TIGR00270 family protein [Nanoarchaeota archaeon]|nr:TIGR00270 family protein [Nanoarchaeota archaeon]
MMCEMCGQEKLHLYKAIVEGSLLSVCDKCKNFGNVISVEKPKLEEQKKVKKPEPKFVDEEKQEVVVDDFAKKIKEAREKMALTQEQMAKSIAEKESIIHKIESNLMVPPMSLIKKLEQFLRIKLIEEFDSNKRPVKDFSLKDETVTIGDLIRIKKK